MGYYQLLMKINDIAVGCINNLFEVKSFFNPKLWKARYRMHFVPKMGYGRSIYIVLNGPSLKKQDLTKLKGKIVMFVNRGWMHEAYEIIQPAYHVFIDSKLRDGIWDIKWFDEIWTKSPKTKIILPISWYNHPRFKNYKKDTRIYWLFWNLPFHNLAVSGACLSFAVYNGFKNIYITGNDQNAIAHEMLNHSETHFYGDDPELRDKKSDQLAIDLYANSRHFHDLNRFASYCKKHGINCYNLTNGGLVDSFERIDFDKHLSIL